MVKVVLPMKDKVGKHKVILKVAEGSKVYRRTQEVEVINSDIRSIQQISGAWAGIYHWSEEEGKHWNQDIKKMTDATVWCEAGFDNFRGGGFSSHFVTRAEMPATMIRLNLVKGLGPVLQIAEGWTVKLPDEVTDTLMERTNPTWPCTWFTPRCDGKSGSPFESAYSVMQNWGANHGAISYGHVGADLITLCSMLRIPVCMHNVADKDVFRPAAWNAFGMDKEGQDYRACAAYGPMYKNIR